MGMIRFLLALSVVAAHSGGIGGLHFVGGKIAVQTFFIISGFYMALILQKKYSRKGTYWLFITNRLLRIYPLYVIVLVLSIVFYLSAFSFGDTNIITLYAKHFFSSSVLFQCYLVISQISIVGLDWVMFLGVTQPLGTLFITTNYLQTPQPLLYNFLFIPQAWTLSLEILFYLLIPLIIRHRNWMIGIFVCAILLRMGIYSAELHHEPWTNRFFPTELPFFLLGVFLFKLAPYIQKLVQNRRYVALSYCVFLVFICFYEKIPYISFGVDIKQLGFYTIFSIGLPFFFDFTKQSVIDHVFGELSYPIYISHMLMFSVMQFFQIPPVFGLVTTISTVIFSYFLYTSIQNPIDRLRQLRVQSLKKRVTK